MSARLKSWSALGLGAWALLLTTGCLKNHWPVAEFRQSIARQELSRGEQLMAQRQYPEAARAFERAVSQDPGAAAAHAGLGRIRELEGNLEAAVAHYQAAMKAAPDDSAYALALGDALRKAAVTSINRPRLLSAAVRAYRHALLLDDKNYSAALGLGMCHRLNGRIDLSITAYRRAQQMEPNNAEALLLLASLYESQSLYDKAMDEYRTALRVDPENARVHNAFAALNLRMTGGGGPQATLARQRALAHYRKSLEVNPDQPHILQLLSELDPSYRTAVTRAPEDP